MFKRRVEVQLLFTPRRVWLSLSVFVSAFWCFPLSVPSPALLNHSTIKGNSKAAALQTPVTTEDNIYTAPTTDLCHIANAKLGCSAKLLKSNVMMPWQVQSGLAVTVCSVKVAFSEDAVFSTVSGTTTSKTCSARQVMTPSPWSHAGADSWQGGRRELHSSCCQRLPPPLLCSPDTEQVKYRQWEKRKGQGSQKGNG